MKCVAVTGLNKWLTEVKHEKRRKKISVSVVLYFQYRGANQLPKPQGTVITLTVEHVHTTPTTITTTDNNA